MPIPNLTPVDSKAKYHSTGQGAPVNGNNVFNLGIEPKAKVDPNRLIFNVTPLGPSITGASFVSYDPVTGNVTMSFAQSGADQCVVDANLEHSIEW
jgi:hypothetical protein